MTTSLRTIYTWSIIAGLLTFVAGGFSETYFALQTGAIVVALLVTIARKHIARTKVFSFLVAGLLGSIAAGVVDFFAPGNQFRRNAFPPPPGPIELSHIVSIGLRDFFQILLPSTTSRIDLLGLTLCAFIVGTGVFRGGKLDAGASRQFWPLIWLPLAGLALLLSCVVPMAYATSLPLAYRTLIIPTYVLVCILSVWGYRLGQLSSGAYQWLVQRAPWSKVVPVAILFAFALWAFDSSRKMLKLQPAMLGYSRAWDERERMIENSKSQRIPYAIVRRLHNWAALDEIEPDPKIVWLTKCV